MFASETVAKVFDGSTVRNRLTIYLELLGATNEREIISDNRWMYMNI